LEVRVEARVLTESGREVEKLLRAEGPAEEAHFDLLRVGC